MHADGKTMLLIETGSLKTQILTLLLLCSLISSLKMARRSLLSWTAEITWQCLFYFALPSVLVPMIHYLAKNVFPSYIECFRLLVVIFLALGWIIPTCFYGTLYLGAFKSIEKYRIQEWVWNREDSPRKRSYMQVIRKTVETLIFGQIIITSPIVYYLFDKCLDHDDDLAVYLDNYPGVIPSFIRLMVGLFMFETCFYWFHRFLHSKYAYRYV